MTLLPAGNHLLYMLRDKMNVHKDLEKLLGRRVKVHTKRYGIDFLNESIYMVTGISREMDVNSDGIVKVICKVKVSRELTSRNSVWLAAEEVSLI